MTKAKRKRKQRPMLPKLTEAQAWQVVARFFGINMGLCHAVGGLAVAGAISAKTARAMYDAIDAERERQRAQGTLSASIGFVWPPAESRCVTDSARYSFALDAAKRAAGKGRSRR